MINRDVRVLGYTREAAWRKAVQLEQEIRQKYKTLPGNIPHPVQEVTGYWVVWLTIKLNKVVDGPLLPTLQYWDLRKISPAYANGRRRAG